MFSLPIYTYFYCSYVNTKLLLFIASFSEIVHNYAKFLINELELKNGCEAVETVFLFLIACFYNKMSHTNWTFVMRNHKFTLFSVFLFLFSKNKLLSYTISSWKTSVISCLTPGHWDTTSRWHRLWTTQVHTTGKRTKQTQLFWVPIESITRNETLISSILIKNVLPRTI